MPKIVKLNEFSNSDTTENKYGKFEKVEIKQNKLTKTLKMKMNIIMMLI